MGAGVAARNAPLTRPRLAAREAARLQRPAFLARLRGAEQDRLSGGRRLLVVVHPCRLRVVVGGGSGVGAEKDRIGGGGQSRAVPARPCAGLGVQYARAAIGRLALSRTLEISQGRLREIIFGCLVCFFLGYISGGIPLHPRRQLPSIPQRRCYGNKIEMNAHRMRL